MDTCPRCLDNINDRNRLIYESCGHYKCKKCFLLDEIECLDCQAKLPSEVQKDCENQVTDHFEQQTTVNNTIEEEPSSSVIKNKDVKSKNSLPNHVKMIIKSDGNTVFSCDFCKKTFKSRNQRYYHLYCDDINKSPHKCKTCAKIFSSAYHLSYHQQSHENQTKHICEKCNKVFTRQQTLKRHLKEHINHITYNCSNCDAVFKNKIAYLGHVQKHKNLFSYSCNDCDKKFTIKSNFKQHLLIHSEDKKFKCSECMKRFARKSSYKTHLLRHADKKNFQCLECSKMFIDKKTLDRHIKIHQGEKDVISYKCSLCDVKSKRKDNLIRHMRNMHCGAKSNNIISIEKEKSNDTTPKTSPSSSIIRSEKSENNVQNISETFERINNNDIVVKSSVIRSIGNVEPVIIPNILNLDSVITDDLSQTKSLDTPVVKINKENRSSTLITNKKPKKKYDPCEIYRKILLAGNDEDSIAESEDITTEEHSSSCCIEANSNINNNNNNNNNDLNEDKKQSSLSLEKNTEFPSNSSNFAEIHWRKRTSQYFLNMFD